jgi:hypothetical protein
MIDGEDIDKADSFLTKLKNLLKKHWGLLLFLLLGYGIYKFCVLVGEGMANTPIPIQQEQYYDSILPEKETTPYIIEDNGIVPSDNQQNELEYQEETPVETTYIQDSI